MRIYIYICTYTDYSPGNLDRPTMSQEDNARKTQTTPAYACVGISEGCANHFRCMFLLGAKSTRDQVSADTSTLRGLRLGPLLPPASKAEALRATWSGSGFLRVLQLATLRPLGFDVCFEAASERPGSRFEVAVCNRIWATEKPKALSGSVPSWQDFRHCRGQTQTKCVVVMICT